MLDGAPPLGSSRRHNRGGPIRACDIAPAHIAQGSSVTHRSQLLEPVAAEHARRLADRQHLGMRGGSRSVRGALAALATISPFRTTTAPTGTSPVRRRPSPRVERRAHLFGEREAARTAPISPRPPSSRDERYAGAAPGPTRRAAPSTAHKRRPARNRAPSGRRRSGTPARDRAPDRCRAAGSSTAATIRPGVRHSAPAWAMRPGACFTLDRRAPLSRSSSPPVGTSAVLAVFPHPDAARLGVVFGRLPPSVLYASRWAGSALLLVDLQHAERHEYDHDPRASSPISTRIARIVFFSRSNRLAGGGGG